MEEKAIRLFAVRRNFSENCSQVIFDGMGKLIQEEDGLTLTYFEEENQGASVEVIVKDNQLWLNRKHQELSTNLYCIVNELSDIQVANQYGQFPLKAYTHHIEYQDKKLTFIYDVVNGTEVIESYRFDWKWEEKSQ